MVMRPRVKIIIDFRWPKEYLYPFFQFYPNIDFVLSKFVIDGHRCPNVPMSFSAGTNTYEFVKRGNYILFTVTDVFET